MSDYTLVIVAGVFVVAFIVWQIIRWIMATVSLGKSVHDGVKQRSERKRQWQNLTSTDDSPPSTDSD